MVIQEERPVLWEAIVSVVVIKEVYMNMCRILNGYRGWGFEYTNTKAWWLVIKKEKLLTLYLILIYCLNERFVTVPNRCSKIPPSTSMYFATRVRCSRVFRLSWSSRFFMLPAASKTRARNSSHVSTFLLQTSAIIQLQKQREGRTVRWSINSSFRLQPDDDTMMSKSMAWV